MRSGPGHASTRQSGPPCSHSSCRQRPHGISGVAGAVHAGQRDQPAAAGGVQRRHHPALGAQRHAVRRRSPRCSRPPPGRRRPARPRRPGTSSTARTRCRITSMAAARSADPVDLHGSIRLMTALALDVRLAVGGRRPDPPDQAGHRERSSPGTAACQELARDRRCRSRRGRSPSWSAKPKNSDGEQRPDRAPPAEDQRGQRDEALAADHVLGEAASRAAA